MTPYKSLHIILGQNDARSRYSIHIAELTSEMPRCFCISIQSGAAWRLVDAASDVNITSKQQQLLGTCYFTDAEVPDDGEDAAPLQFMSNRR